ncbi:mevalonate kinase family protein [Nonomuraea polychroma]|uniref:mevalonate kinase family protein n=1 Tax=Nonomuraea polychroma TaxID=46176 RepID=UPI003D8DAFA2
MTSSGSKVFRVSLSEENYMTSVVATRVCLAGDALDYLGGRTVCAAVDLPTIVVDTGRGVWFSPAHEALTRDLEQFVRDSYADVTIEPTTLAATCTAPSPGGLGTSSSICIGLLREILRRCGEDPADAVRLAYDFEFQRTHGGGVDHVSIAHGGWLFTLGCDSGLPTTIDFRGAADGPQWSVTLIDTGLSKDCGDAIGRFRQLQRNHCAELASYIRDLDATSAQVWEAVLEHDLKGVLAGMDDAHALMRDRYELSDPRIERLRDAAMSATGGVFKLTGSGNGGCLFTLHRSDEQSTMRTALIKAGIEPMSVYHCRVAEGLDGDSAAPPAVKVQS